MTKRHIIHSSENNLVITSELEIQQILDGLKAIMYHCLEIKSSDMPQVKEEFDYLVETRDETTIAEKFKNLFSSSEFNAQKSVGNSEPQGLK